MAAADPAASTPDPTSPALAFSRLVVRPADSDYLGVADDTTNIFVVEYLRKQHINAVGAESLVFDKDRSDEADFVLGGTVFSGKCEKDWGVTDCVVGIKWEVLDVAQDEVIYTARVYGQAHLQSTDKLATTLITDALHSLIKKPKFKQLLAPKTVTTPSPGFPMAELQSCDKPAVAVETDGERSLNAVAIVEVGNSFGSAFQISKSPFLLTAAHVVDRGHPTLKFRNGHTTPAEVIRIDEASDVALLRAQTLPPDSTCLQLVAAPNAKMGASVFALGSPASKELSFSMSRGILSGLRLINGVQQLQTDAAMSPGNSGGPLIDKDGVAIGITSWKLAGGSVEGLGFAVSVVDALDRLGIKLAAETSHSLLLAESAHGPKLVHFKEPADAKPVLNPDRAAREATVAEERRKEKEEEERQRLLDERRRKMTPAYVPALRWGGIITATAGLGTVIASAVNYDSESMSKASYQSTRTANDIGWLMTIVGTTAFVASFPLAPSEKELTEGKVSLDLRLHPSGVVDLKGTF